MKTVTKIEKSRQVSKKIQKTRVAAYARVSTDSDAQLESLETQKSHYESYIKARDDWEFAGLYFDEGITGTKAEKRPALMQLITDCKLKKIDFVITKSISRFSRNTTDCLEIVRDLLVLGIPVYFEKENLNTGSMESELFLSILSSMAESESTSISQNSKWSIQKRFKNGTFKLSYPPYGYIWDGTNMVIEPEQAEVVKRIFKDVLSGKGTDAVARALNREKVPSKKGGKWTSSSVRSILSNEKYVGDVLFQKTYTDDQFNRHRNDGFVNQYYAENHHEAIISREDFTAVAELIAQRAAEKNIDASDGKYQKRYALSGKIKCSECGSTFKRRQHYSTYQKYAAWTCSTHLEDTSRCSMLYIKEDDIILAFLTMMNKLIYSHRFILKPYVSAIENNTGDNSIKCIKDIERKLEANTEQRETLTKLMASGYIDQILYTTESNELLTEADRLKEEIETINKTMAGADSKIFDAQDLLHFCEHNTFLQEYDESLFEEFVDHIEVITRNELAFVLKCGLTLREVI